MGSWDQNPPDIVTNISLPSQRQITSRVASTLCTTESRTLLPTTRFRYMSSWKSNLRKWNTWTPFYLVPWNSWDALCVNNFRPWQFSCDATILPPVIKKGILALKTFKSIDYHFHSFQTGVVTGVVLVVIVAGMILSLTLCCVIRRDGDGDEDFKAVWSTLILHCLNEAKWPCMTSNCK